MKKIITITNINLTNKELSDALLIFQNAHSSSLSLFQAFELVRQDRGRKRGMTTDQEQDILRAMLVMACAGLDAGLKQLIRDALPLLVKKNSDAQSGLEKFVERQVRGEDADYGANAKYLAKLLASSSPYNRVVETYINALTGDSLQSTEQLFKAINALGLDPKSLHVDRDALKPAFQARNQIIHELDIDLQGERRKRILRGMEEMIGWTNQILTLTAALIEATDKMMPKIRLRRR